MKLKLKVKHLIIILIPVLLIIFSVSWFSMASTPKGAILEYSWAHGLKYSRQNVKIQETTYMDPSYGKQFTADGIEDEWGQNFPFFYLKKNIGIWYVTMAGTGP